MPIYEFGSQFTFTNFTPGPKAMSGGLELAPQINFYPPTATQNSDVGGQTALTWEQGRVDPTEIAEFTSPGFRYLDEGMIHYWSDIRIPVRDTVKFMRIIVAGSNKSLQVWKDELKHGRAKLPVCAISRTNHQYNPEKFSYPYHPVATRYLNNQRTRVAKTLRPVPYLIDYNLTIWAEHKHDAEHALYQMMTRFNPLAEFRVSDGHVVGNVQLRYGGVVDNTDKDSPAEQLAKVKYELTCTAEAWLSLPEQIVPSVVSTHSIYKLGSESIPADRIRLGGPHG